MKKRKHAFITGCSGSLGTDILKTLIKKKFQIICHSRKKTGHLNDLIKLNKTQIVKNYNFDLQNKSKMDQCIKNLQKSFDCLDLLVLNAATPHGGILELTKLEDIKKVYEVNFFSQIYLIQKLTRLLKKSSNASIIIISSISGLIPNKGNIAYGGSKAAMNYATKVLAEEFANYNIRVNSIAPIVLDNSMGEKMNKTSREKMISETFQKKILKNSDVINMFLFLISKKSERINGQILRIDGGMNS